MSNKLQRKPARYANKGSQKSPTPVFKGSMRYELPDNVFETALNRIRWVFEEFDDKVAVFNSGGKDSTVTIELAAMVAKERNVLPLTVFWLDQECEFEATVTYQRYIMYEREDIDFRWYQIPFPIDNATNHGNRWLNVWGEGEEWIRDKEPDSIKKNVYGPPSMEFYDLLKQISVLDWDGVFLDGMRSEESPIRRMAMTSGRRYKWATWASRDKGKAKGTRKELRLRFHPIYDWAVGDVWKAIYDNDWKYNTHYDAQFRYGISVRDMRVSSYTHETALGHLAYLQEVEPETWEKAVKRLGGINTHGQLGTLPTPKTLPYMFGSWGEYAHYLIDNLAENEVDREVFRRQWGTIHRTLPDVDETTKARAIVMSVISNDTAGSRLANLMNTHYESKGTR